MTCTGPGATHHLACECREREHAAEVASLRAELDEMKAGNRIAADMLCDALDVTAEAGWVAESLNAIDALRARLAACERVVEAAKAWIDHLESKGGRYNDGVPGDLMDALAALDGKEAE